MSYDEAYQHLCVVVLLCLCLPNVGTGANGSARVERELLFTPALLDMAAWLSIV